MVFKFLAEMDIVSSFKTSTNLFAFRRTGTNLICLANDYPTGRFLRDAKLWEIGAGTTEVRKLILGRHFNDLYL